MSHSRVWSTEEAVPDDNDQISAGAGGIRNHMVDVRERMALDHIWASSTATDGYHTTVHLQGRGDNPTAVASYMLLFAKTSTAGAIALYVTGSGTQVPQLTDAGYLYLGYARIPNNTYILASNSAGTANINMWKVNGSNLITAGTALTSLTIVTPLVMSDTGVNTNLNASHLNYYSASTAVTATTIMVSDTAGRCSSFLKQYDSGWFAVTTSTAYSKTHNLGTTKCLITILISDSSDGSGKVTMANNFYYEPNNSSGSFVITALSTTTISFRSGNAAIAYSLDSAGANWQPTSGYAKVIMLALE